MNVSAVAGPLYTIRPTYPYAFHMFEGMLVVLSTWERSNPCTLPVAMSKLRSAACREKLQMSMIKRIYEVGGCFFIMGF